MKTTDFEILSIDQLDRHAERIDNHFSYSSTSTDCQPNYVYNCMITCSGGCSLQCGGNCEGGCKLGCGGSCEGGCVGGCKGGFF